MIFVERPRSQRHYRAFISYRHADNTQEGRRWAEWLHRGLERYVVPPDLIGTPNLRGDTIRDSLYPIFRDEDELPANADLATGIRAALEVSDYLIVLCSPRSAVSPWVRKEVREFKELGRSDRILAIIIAGEPNADDPAKAREGITRDEECFCEELRFGAVRADGTLDWTARTEPLAADLRPSGVRAEGFVTAEAYREHLALNSSHPPEKIAALTEAYRKRLDQGLWKVIAGLLGVALGTLVNRDAAHRASLAEKEAERQRQIAERERRLADEARKAEKDARAARSDAESKAHRLAVAGAATLILALLAGWLWWKAGKEGAEAIRQRDAAQEANKQSKIARNDAEGLINFMMYSLYDQLRKRESLDVLGDSIGKVEEYYSRNPPTDSVNLAKYANLQGKRAMVLKSLGKTDEAFEMAKKSWGLISGLAVKNPSSVSLKLSMADALSIYQQAARGVNKQIEVLVLVEDALKSLDAQLSRSTDEGEDMADLCDKLGSIWNIVFNGTTGAKQLYAAEQQVKYAQRCAQLSPSSDGAKRAVAMSNVCLGEAWFMRAGELPQKLDRDVAYGRAVQFKQVSVDLNEALLKTDPKNAIWLRDDIEALMNLARTKHRAGLPSVDFEKSFKQAIERAEQLLRLDPVDLDYIELWSSCHGEYADLLADVNRAKDAVVIMANVPDKLDKLLLLRPKNQLTIRHCSDIWSIIAKCLKLSGDHLGAIEAYNRSVSILRSTAVGEDEDGELRRRLSFNLFVLANEYMEVRKFTEALPLAQESVNIDVKLRKVLESKLGNSVPGMRIGLATSHRQVAKVFFALGQAEDAVKQYHNTTALLIQVSKEFPNDPSYQAEVLKGFLSVVDTLRTEKQQEPAAEAAQEYIEHIHELMPSIKDRRIIISYLDSIYSRLGTIRLEQHRLDEAANAYQKQASAADDDLSLQKTGDTYSRAATAHGSYGFVLAKLDKRREALVEQEQSSKFWIELVQTTAAENPKCINYISQLESSIQNWIILLREGPKPDPITSVLSLLAGATSDKKPTTLAIYSRLAANGGLRFEASDAARRALMAAPENAEVLYLTGWAYFLLHETGNAQANLEKAVALAKKNPLSLAASRLGCAQALLGLIEEQAGRHDSALALFRSLFHYDENWKSVDSMKNSLFLSPPDKDVLGQLQHAALDFK